MKPLMKPLENPCEGCKRNKDINMEPKLIGIKGGWAAVSKDWAVFGETKDDAINKFRNAEVRHAEIASRDDSESKVESGA